jgi:hypothetical protein
MTSKKTTSDDHSWVEIRFDCLPLRSLPRIDAPLDASPKLAAKLLRIRQAIAKHGTYNTYYLHNASCVFHLTNDPEIGSVRFELEGTLFTSHDDRSAANTELHVTLEKETCDWLNQSVVTWLAESVPRAVRVEFDKYIAAGDLAKTRERMESIEHAVEESQGFVGMYL